VTEWLARLRAIDVGRIRYDGVDRERVETLRRRYRIDYWIVPRDRGATDPLAYANGGFQVLRLIASPMGVRPTLDRDDRGPRSSDRPTHGR
jgi:hypothetical protein